MRENSVQGRAYEDEWTRRFTVRSLVPIDRSIGNKHFIDSEKVRVLYVEERRMKKYLQWVDDAVRETEKPFSYTWMQYQGRGLFINTDVYVEANLRLFRMMAEALDRTALSEDEKKKLYVHVRARISEADGDVFSEMLKVIQMSRCTLYKRPPVEDGHFVDGNYSCVVSSEKRDVPEYARDPKEKAINAFRELSPRVGDRESYRQFCSDVEIVIRAYCEFSLGITFAINIDSTLLFDNVNIFYYVLGDVGLDECVEFSYNLIASMFWRFGVCIDGMKRNAAYVAFEYMWLVDETERLGSKGRKAAREAVCRYVFNPVAVLVIAQTLFAFGGERRELTRMVCQAALRSALLMVNTNRKAAPFFARNNYRTDSKTGEILDTELRCKADGYRMAQAQVKAVKKVFMDIRGVSSPVFTDRLIGHCERFCDYTLLTVSIEDPAAKIRTADLQKIIDMKPALRYYNFAEIEHFIHWDY